MTEFTLRVRNSDVVQNIQDVHGDKPRGFNSWKDYWLYHSDEEWPEKCRYRGCGDAADGSAHVNVNGDEDSVYIIPMCDHHLSPGFEEAFEVNSGTIAVYIVENNVEEPTDRVVSRILYNFDNVRNIQSAHRPKPRGFNSWKDYWLEHSDKEWPEKCRYRGCRDTADGSAHVNINGDEDSVYIIPMCDYHLSPGFDETFEVNSGTTAVYIGESDVVEPTDGDSLLSLIRGEYVRNCEGTSECTPKSSRYKKTWKKFWIGKSGNQWPHHCCILNCYNRADGGAHVNVWRHEGIFIVPMCNWHNDPHKTDWFAVKNMTVAVGVTEEDSCGTRGTCF